MRPNGESELQALFVQCVGCGLDCERIVRRPERGVPPRGFALGKGSASDKVLMVVFGEAAPISVRLDGKDDGLHQLERQRYQRALRDGGLAGLAAEQAAVTLEPFTSGRSPMHKRTMGLLRDIFGTGERAAKATYFTTLTKCEKQEPPPPTRGWEIPSTTRTTCFDLYLKREVELLDPRAILAFGNVAELAPSLAAERTVVLDHPGRRPGGPSWLYGSERERTIARVRVLIAGALG